MRPVLPNLQSFNVFNSFDPAELSKIIDALICPTLVEIRTPGCAWGSLHPVSSSYLISRLADSSPDIHTLELYTGILYPKPRTTETIPEPLPQTILFSSLGDGAPRLCNLRTIGMGPEVFSSNVLALLGMLPNLESLTICFPYEMAEHLFPSTFAPLPNAFPVLKHLGIFCQSITLINQLWRALPFVHCLKSAYVKALLSEVTGGEPELVYSICQHSPNVTDLCLDFASDFSRLEVLTPSVVHQLGQLPLERIRIIAWTADLLPPDGERFALALSHVEYLQLEDCCFTLEDLSWMASYMPKLRFLLSQLELPDPSSVDDLFIPPVNSPSPSIIHLETAFTLDLRREFEIDEVDDRYIVSLARTLHMLWPNGVHCELSQRARDGGNCKESDVKSLILLNTTLKNMCSTKEFDTQAMNQYSASEWEFVNSTNIRWLNLY